MILFLTSSPTGPLDGSRPVEGLDQMNGFREAVARRWPDKARCLMITAFPEDDAANDEMRGFFERALRLSGLDVFSFDLWDRRTPVLSREEVRRYQVILLGGGHVPTQNAFFRRIGLREKIQDFPGIVIGISAGSMNAADIVYAQPEEPGESVDPAYQRFLPGLGLTKTQILPHYQMMKDRMLDGRRLFEDITYPDSWGRSFLALCDGSYLLCEEGQETVFGEAYRIENGVRRPV